LAKVGTEAELHPEAALETEADAAAGAGAGAAGAGAGAAGAGAGAAGVPCRQQAAHVVPLQPPCGHLEGQCLVVENMFSTYLSIYPGWFGVLPDEAKICLVRIFLFTLAGLWSWFVEAGEDGEGEGVGREDENKANLDE